MRRPFYIYSEEIIERIGKRQYWKIQQLEIFKIKEKCEYLKNNTKFQATQRKNKFTSKYLLAKMQTANDKKKTLKTIRT